MEAALWCERNGLEAEARAHFTAVTRLDPSREAAWKQLGCKKVGHRWLTAEQIAAEEAEAEAQRKADQHWKPLLTKWHGWLRDKDKTSGTRPRSTWPTSPTPAPSPQSGRSSARRGGRARRRPCKCSAGSTPAGRRGPWRPWPSIGKSGEVRRIATETLKRRDPRDFVGLLIGMVRDPLKYEIRPVDGPTSPGVLFVEGERYNVRTMYGLTQRQIDVLNTNPLPPRLFASCVPFDPYSAQNYLTAMGPAAVGVATGHGGAIVAPNLTVLAGNATSRSPVRSPGGRRPWPSASSS